MKKNPPKKLPYYPKKRKVVKVKKKDKKLTLDEKIRLYLKERNGD